MDGRGPRLRPSPRPTSIGARAAALCVALSLVGAPCAAQEARVSRGVAVPGYEIVVAPRDGEPRTLCEPDCELALPHGELRLGWRRGGAIEWQRDLLLDRDVRLDVRMQDLSLLRGTGYALLVTAAVLLGATAIVGIATEPTPPDYGWFGDHHALVFAGIAGGIVIAFGGPGVGLALAFQRDQPGLEVVPED